MYLKAAKIPGTLTRALSEPAPWRDLGGRYMSSSLSHEVPWGPRQPMAKPGQAVAARAKRGKRGVLLAALEVWPLPSHASGRDAPPQL